jgi:hypothetical protein
MRKFDGRRSGRRALVVVAVPVALLASGCTATGGGSIPSELSPMTDKATFGFSIDADAGTWSGSYHDPQGVTTDLGVVDVRFKGTGKTHPCNTDPRCVKLASTAKGGCIPAQAPYQSQNPNIPGSGLVSWYVCDMDGDVEPDVDAADTLLVIVDTGPYMGYTNGGDVQGNITTRS